MFRILGLDYLIKFENIIEYRNKNINNVIFWKNFVDIEFKVIICNRENIFGFLRVFL